MQGLPDTAKALYTGVRRLHAGDEDPSIVYRGAWTESPRMQGMWIETIHSQTGPVFTAEKGQSVGGKARDTCMRIVLGRLASPSPFAPSLPTCRSLYSQRRSRLEWKYNSGKVSPSDTSVMKPHSCTGAVSRKADASRARPREHLLTQCSAASTIRRRCSSSQTRGPVVSTSSRPKSVATS